MLVILIYNHRTFGFIARTVWLFHNNDSKYDFEFVDKNNSKNHNLSEQCLQIVNQSDLISDSSLFLKYGRKKYKNIKDFLSNASKEEIEKQIRPYIEKVNSRIVFDGMEQNLQFFSKEIQFITKNNRLDVLNENIEFEFLFDLKESELLYSLVLKEKGLYVDIQGYQMNIISNTPAIFILNKRLFYVEHLRSLLIKTFTTNKEIRVPKHIIKTYFDTYILKILAHYDAKATGFTIETKKVNPSTSITVIDGISQEYELEVNFIYNNLKISSNTFYTKFVLDNPKNMGVTRYIRDIEYEKQIINTLTKKGLVNISEGTFVHSKKYYNIFSWINANKQFLESINVNIKLPESIQNIFVGNIKNNLEISDNIDWFELKGFICFDQFEIPISKLRKHLLNNIREFTLPNGQIAHIPEELFEKIGPLLHIAKIESNKILFNRFRGEQLAEAGFNVIQNAFHSLNNNYQPDNPPDMPIKLRDYQTKGFHWLSNLQKNKIGGILADDMGLGKTVQIITLLLSLYQNNTKSKIINQKTNVQLSLFDNQIAIESILQPSLIIVPASLIDNWNIELAKFAPSLKVMTFIGHQREFNLKRLDKHHVIISSYGTIRNDIEKLSKYKFEYIVLDESQMIKNPDSATYIAVNELKGKYRITLTGTPIENSLSDLWTQFEFVNPGFLGPFNYFKNRYITEIEKKQNHVRSQELKRIISPFILRRTKNDVAKELPKKTEQTVYCTMTEEQEKRYIKDLSAVRNEYLKLIETGENQSKTKIFAFSELMKLRLLANDPRIAGYNEFSTSGKFMTVTSHLDELNSEKHKVLIFSSFVKHLSLYEDYCNDMKYRYVTLTGKTPQKERHKIVKRFQEDENIRFFFISLKSGGFGLNLQSANYVILLDPWWNPQAENQAIDRAHRIGQDKNVHINRYITKNSVEEKIQILQEKKRSLSNDIIENNSYIKTFDFEDMKSILD